MADYVPVNVDTSPNTGRGDSIRTAFQKINNNFDYFRLTEIPAQVGLEVGKLSSTFTGGTAGVEGSGEITGFVRILSTDPSLSTTTGALTVAGGVGITGNVYVDDVRCTGTIFSTDISADNIVLNESAAVSGNLTVSNTLIASNSDIAEARFGNVVVDSNVTVTQNCTVSSISSEILSVTASASVQQLSVTGDTTMSGNLVLQSGTFNFREGNLFITGSSGISSAARLKGNSVVALGSTSSTSVDTGSLICFGGTGIAGNINVGGTANFSGDFNVAGKTKISAGTVPSGPTATGEPGQLSWDSQWFYVCVGTNQWIRFAKDTGVW